VEGYFSGERSVGLEFDPAVAVGFVHLVGAAPIEGDGMAVAGAAERAGDAAEGELAFGVAEEDVGGLDEVKEVLVPGFHLDDPPFALEAHAAASSGLGRRTRL